MYHNRTAKQIPGHELKDSSMATLTCTATGDLSPATALCIPTLCIPPTVQFGVVNPTASISVGATFVVDCDSGKSQHIVLVGLDVRGLSVSINVRSNKVR